jgi:NADH-quinone oxidoreductase subunit M
VAYRAGGRQEARRLLVGGHLGFVVLGIFAFTTEALQGAMIQMVNHGLSTGALFLIIGMIYERRHTRLMADFGGIAKSVPV